MRVAAVLLSAGGVDAVQFPEVARAAGVTRQFVYRFFPNRQALIVAVLEDFATVLDRRFMERAAHHLPRDMAEATRVFVEAVCDTMEELGSGAWRLLATRNGDAEISRVAGDIEERLMAPWRPRIAATTGADRQEVAVLAGMIVAAGRVVLEQWIAGELDRDAAATLATRGVVGLLAAFSRAGHGRVPVDRARPRPVRRQR